MLYFTTSQSSLFDIDNRARNQNPPPFVRRGLRKGVLSPYPRRSVSEIRLLISSSTQVQVDEIDIVDSDFAVAIHILRSLRELP